MTNQQIDKPAGRDARLLSQPLTGSLIPKYLAFACRDNNSIMGEMNIKGDEAVLAQGPA